jgi:hypothetical protein
MDNKPSKGFKARGSDKLKNIISDLENEVKIF